MENDMKTTLNQDTSGHIDMSAIELEARKLRAEAARDMMRSVGKWMRGRFTHRRAPNTRTPNMA